MPAYRLGRAARLLGVSVDFVRRDPEAGRPQSARAEAGRRAIQGAEPAGFAGTPGGHRGASGSNTANDHLEGVVASGGVGRDVKQLELRCGPLRAAFSMTRGAVDRLASVPGVSATAVIHVMDVVVGFAKGRAVS